MQDTGNKGEGERSVFTYTTDSETRSFRSIAQKIQARSGDGIYTSELPSRMTQIQERNKNTLQNLLLKVFGGRAREGTFSQKGSLSVYLWLFCSRFTSRISDSDGGLSDHKLSRNVSNSVFCFGESFDNANAVSSVFAVSVKKS